MRDGTPREAYQKMLYPMVNASLKRYVEREILPRYNHFDQAHRLDHVQVVMAQSMELAGHYPELNPDMEEATNNYVEQLKNLTETLQKVSEQSERLTRDSEEMENLNRTLTGICKVYEMQLKGASQQIGTIDEINEQTRKMADQIAELNRIYARMIEAMTTNMPKTPMAEGADESGK
jgi:uncharacterized phage infection (PIP) family protein YhgE